MTPENERHKDVWDLYAFGHSGHLTFTEITQPWLLEATKQWAYNDLPKRRGHGAGGVTRTHINGVARLSESLRLQRADHGDNVTTLGRQDITAFLNRMAFLHDQGKISAHTRLRQCREIRLVLAGMRSLGLRKPGKPLHGLPDDFALTRDDMPDEPEDSEAGKDLPSEVMRHLCAHLDTLEELTSRESRVAVELMIDTGRRPHEIAQLGLDCLERDPDGEPVLVYDNHKANRKARRLPIPKATAAVIVAQQERVRARFPDTAISDLRLLPAATRNPAGRRAVSDDWISMRHRTWVDSLPDVQVPTVIEQDGQQVTKMLPFDTAKIFPYAYRHTFAQRHADAGVDVTVLKELLDHRLLETTQRYFNPQKLHQIGENLQVACCVRRGNDFFRVNRLVVWPAVFAR